MAEDGVIDTVEMVSQTSEGPGPLHANPDLHGTREIDDGPEQWRDSQYRNGFTVIEAAQAWRAFPFREKLGRRVDRIGLRAVELYRRCIRRIKRHLIAGSPEQNRQTEKHGACHVQ